MFEDQNEPSRVAQWSRARMTSALLSDWGWREKRASMIPVVAWRVRHGAAWHRGQRQRRPLGRAMNRLRPNVLIIISTSCSTPFGQRKCCMQPSRRCSPSMASDNRRSPSRLPPPLLLYHHHLSSTIKTGCWMAYGTLSNSRPPCRCILR